MSRICRKKKNYRTLGVRVKEEKNLNRRKELVKVDKYYKGKEKVEKGNRGGLSIIFFSKKVILVCRHYIRVFLICIYFARTIKPNW